MASSGGSSSGETTGNAGANISENNNSNKENEGKISQKINETAQTATEAAKLAASVSSGNVGEAVKSAAKLAKSKMGKKNIKKLLIMSCAWILIIVVIVSTFLTVLKAVLDKIIELGSKLIRSVQSFWNWLTNDYWIKLDEDIEYTDSNTRPAEEGKISR